MNTRTQTQAGLKTQNRLITALALSAVAFFFVSTAEAQSKISGKKFVSAADAQSKIGDKREDCGCSAKQTSKKELLDGPGFLNPILSGNYKTPKDESKGGSEVNSFSVVFCQRFDTWWGPVDRCYYYDVYCDTFLWFDITFCYNYPDGW